MARRRTKKRALPQQKKEPFLTSFLQKNAAPLLIGSIVTLGAIVFLATRYFGGQPPQPTPTPPTEATITPTEQPLTLTPSPISPTLSPTITPPVKKLPPTDGEKILYQVKKGDSIFTIAQTFCDEEDSWRYVAEINNISYPYTLFSGKTLEIQCP